jgi:hypothetical protein
MIRLKRAKISISKVIHMDTTWYWILGIVAVIAAALASWRVVTRAKYTKINAENNSIAAGRDVKINSKEDKKPKP